VQRRFLVKFMNRYLFTSPLLHEELYNLVDDKQNRHLRLADYYRRIPGYEEEAAFHYLKAENHKKAIEYLMKSAQLAIEKGGYDSGIHYYQQALDLCQRQKDSADLEVLVALNEGLADVYRSLGDEEKALKYYKVVLDSYKEILKE
jgi:tetratricopeptide (TPR) repeat protein